MMAFGIGMSDIQLDNAELRGLVKGLQDRCAKLEADNEELKESVDHMWDKMKEAVEDGNKLRGIMTGIKKTVTEMQNNGTVENRTGSAHAATTTQSTEQGKKKERNNALAVRTSLLSSRWDPVDSTGNRVASAVLSFSRWDSGLRMHRQSHCGEETSFGPKIPSQAAACYVQNGSSALATMLRGMKTSSDSFARRHQTAGTSSQKRKSMNSPTPSCPNA
jgi:hemerythrin-like domain-containing protein